MDESKALKVFEPEEIDAVDCFKILLVTLGDEEKEKDVVKGMDHFVCIAFMISNAHFK